MKFSIIRGNNQRGFALGLCVKRDRFKAAIGLITFKWWFWHGWLSNSLWWFELKRYWFSDVAKLRIRVLWIMLQANWGADVKESGNE
jgi:hypothetical protein